MVNKEKTIVTGKNAVVAVRDSEGKTEMWEFASKADAQGVADEARSMGFEAIIGVPCCGKRDKEKV